MILWMTYAVMVGLVIGLATTLVERVIRSTGRPTRKLWAGALLLSVMLPAAAPFRSGAVPAEPVRSGATEVSPVVGLLPTGAIPLPRPDLVAIAEPWLAAFWIVASALLALTLVGGFFRLARRSRRWPRARVAGGDFLVSDGFGPALLGVLSPEVVLPPWTLKLDAERLHMVWAHEDEHRRAGDSGLLLGAAVAVVIAPWNPVLWWQLRRLRAAVELDCDARVIGRGVPPLAYGAMLLELSTRIPGLPLPVAALSKPPSLLERRLTMIVRGVKRGGPLSTVLALGLATALVVLACEAPPPTAVEPTAGTVEPAGAVQVSETALKVREFATQSDAGPPLIFIDEVRVERLPATLSPDGIERIEVVKGEAATATFGAEAANGVVRIYTKEDGLAPVAEGAADAKATFEAQQLKARVGVVVAEGDTIARMKNVAFSVREDQPQPDLFVNGEPFDGDLRDLPKELIDRVEVLKGKEGRRDAIYITLKEKKSGGGDGSR